MNDAGSLTFALVWIEQLLTGTLASIIAIFAVAALGLMMTAGRLAWRRGVEVVVGIFLIFGSSTVAHGLLDQPAPQAEDVVPALAVPTVSVAAPRPSVYDPYAGASVPQNRSSSDLLAPRP